jgi:predicted GH43/DUF377 family glycosyl hydrolase
MRALFFLFSLTLFASSIERFEELTEGQQIVVATKRILLAEFPDAHNPSILETDQGILLSFRHCPDIEHNPWVSYIGVVWLNEALEPISTPQLLNTRSQNSRIQSQSEDARLFSYRGRIFLTYNDNIEINCKSLSDRRDIFIAELHYKNSIFTLSTPLKLLHQEKAHISCQKNWMPFEWDKKLLLSYTINPHEIVYANLHNGACYPCYETEANLNWEFGPLRGSTPPLLVDGEYLSFFHSGAYTFSYSSWGHDMWHYFMGVYTFSASPPFEMTSYTPLPIVGEDFYTHSPYWKRIIFPGGFIVKDPFIYVAYGKDDSEIWIGTIDKLALKKALKPVHENL